MSDLGERKTEAYVRLLVDHVPSMLAYWDRELRCRFANRAYERWFGVDPDGLIGTSIRDLLGPELFAANERYMRAALDGQQQVFERVVPGPEGVKRHSLATYIPDVQDGQVAGFLAHVTEVTQLKEVESELRFQIAQREHAYFLLRESESQLRQAQRLGRIGSWSWEAASDITTWSDELYDIFARDRERPAPSLSQHSELYEKESWDRLEAAVSNALHTGECYCLELRYIGLDGRSGWLEARGEAVRDEAGIICGLRGTAQEISLRRHAEDARLRVRILEESHRNKAGLMSRVSHELRTPLNAILGFAELFEVDPTLGKKYRNWAQYIKSSGRHMLQLVDDVLELSAAEGGRLAVRSEEVDLGDLVRMALEQVKPAAKARAIELIGPEETAPITLRSDPTRLRQVVDNLLSNAIKYSRAGDTVTVSVTRNGMAAELTVADTGIGMTAEQLARLFMPFERLGAERTQVTGTGLGLAVTKALVERLGGTISVTSATGVGSTFAVRIPI